MIYIYTYPSPGPSKSLKNQVNFGVDYVLGANDGQWTQALKFSESTGNGQSGHTRPEKRQGLPTKSRKDVQNHAKIVDLIFQTSVNRPRNAEIDEIC
jgi:hypothetical protein